MPGIVWIALAILGVHIVVAFVIVVYVRKSYNLLDERSAALVKAADDSSREVKNAAGNISNIGQRANSALQVLTEP